MDDAERKRWQDFCDREMRDKAERTWATHLALAHSKGTADGLKEGQRSALIETALRMRRAGMTAELIVQLTGVGSKEVEEEERRLESSAVGITEGGSGPEQDPRDSLANPDLKSETTEGPTRPEVVPAPLISLPEELRQEEGIAEAVAAMREALVNAEVRALIEQRNRVRQQEVRLLEQARLKSLREGRQQGRLDSLADIARRMREAGMDSATILALTGSSAKGKEEHGRR